MPLDVSCTDCGQAYPPNGFPYRCPSCGGLYDSPSPLNFDPAQVDCSQPGIWRYRHTFGLPDKTEAVSLGEGNTPLVWAEAFGRRVAFKCEFLNPTGSFKDRGSAVIVAWLRSRGIREIVEDSSGNAGASLAAYASRAGIKAQIFVPESASGPKRTQIEAYGAELTLVTGTRTDVTGAVKKTADRGASYASHAYLPFNIPGYATAAYEIFAQLGNQMPGAVIVPAGQGGLLLGLSRGFGTLRIASNIWSFPKLIGIQARACAPLWVMFTAGGDGSGYVPENSTQAEGVRVRFPLRDGAVVAAVKESGGMIVAVGEEDILPGRDALARLGFYVEPTSAIVWPALAQTIRDMPDPVVAVLTGSGLKSV
jgi:threonine synthase